MEQVFRVFINKKYLSDEIVFCIQDGNFNELFRVGTPIGGRIVCLFSEWSDTFSKSEKILMQAVFTTDLSDE